MDWQQAMIGVEEWEHPSVSVIPVANPAAGVGVTYSPPGSEVTRVMCVTCQLVTEAGAGSRIPTLTFKSVGGVTLGVFPSAFTMAPSKTTVVTWGVGLVSTGANDGPFVTVPIPAMRLEVGCTVSIASNVVVAGDQFSAVAFAVEQWPVRSPIGN